MRSCGGGGGAERGWRALLGVCGGGGGDCGGAELGGVSEMGFCWAAGFSEYEGMMQGGEGGWWGLFACFACSADAPGLEACCRAASLPTPRCSSVGGYNCN